MTDHHHPGPSSFADFLRRHFRLDTASRRRAAVIVILGWIAFDIYAPGSVVFDILIFCALWAEYRSEVKAGRR